MSDFQDLRKQGRGVAWAMVGFCTLSFVACAVPARADGGGQGAFPQGAFSGQIVDSATGKPIGNATVAVRDGRGKVVSWTRTDAQGHYGLAADSLGLLDLSPHHRGLLASLGRGVVQVVSFPVKVVGTAAGAAVGVATDAVKAVDPVGTVKAAMVGAAEGSPIPLAAKAADDMQGVVGAATRNKAHDSAVQAKNSTIEATISGTHDKPKVAPTGPEPGEVALLVSAPQYKEFQGAAGSYWMEAAPTDGGRPDAARAWLDTVRLAPSVDGKNNSDTQDQAAHLTDPTLDPAFAAAGSPVQITVKLQLPAEPTIKVRVVAREAKTHRVVELTPQAGGVYAGTLTLDPKTPLGDTTVTVAALNAAPVGVTLPTEKGTDPLLSFASRLGDLDAGKPYHFDPRILVSENRLDLKMMVLDPGKETPPPPELTPAPASVPTSPIAPAPAPASPPEKP